MREKTLLMDSAAMNRAMLRISHEDVYKRQIWRVPWAAGAEISKRLGVTEISGVMERASSPIKDCSDVV